MPFDHKLLAECREGLNPGPGESTQSTMVMLVRRSGVSEQSIRRIEAGGAPNPTLDTCMALAAAVNRVVDDFWIRPELPAPLPPPVWARGDEDHRP